MCDEDMARVVRQKTCLLMAAAACLQLARDTDDELDKVYNSLFYLI